MNVASSPRLRPPLLLHLLLLASLALGGCGYTYHFKDARTTPGDEHNEWASFFLFGLVGNYEVDVQEFCPQGVHKITSGTNFLTWLVSGVTLGIYSPRKVNIWCASGRTETASFEVDFGSDGRPSHVTKRVGMATWSGDVKAAGGGRYGVLLERDGAVAAVGGAQ